MRRLDNLKRMQELQKMRNVEQHLEPRVVKLEAGLDSLTKSVSELTLVLRENSSVLDNKIDKLTIAVTQAQAPQKTDWSMIISAIFLILALGSAVFWPLNQTANNNKEAIQAAEIKLDSHLHLEQHPVGAALMQRLEGELKGHQLLDERNQQKGKEDCLTLNKTSVDKLEMEMSLSSKFYESQVKMLNDRLVNLEILNKESTSKDNDELRQWRLKAMKKAVSDVSAPTPISIVK